MKYDLQKIREYFAKDTFARHNGMTILEVGEGYALVECLINRNHYNAKGSVQGGLIFTLADFAFAVVSNINDYVTMSQNITITYIRPVFEGKIKAEAKIVSQGKSMVLVEVEVRNSEDKLVAKMHANGFKIKEEGK